MSNDSIDPTRITAARRGLRSLSPEVQGAIRRGDVPYDSELFRMLESVGSGLADPAAVAPPADAEAAAVAEQERIGSLFYPQMSPGSGSYAAKQGDGTEWLQQEAEQRRAVAAVQDDDAADPDAAAEPQDIDALFYPTMTSEGAPR